ncbi:DNA alkylation repair protein [Enterococcus saccharolyticus]|uniref:DNA alkylation repair protein n=1 Tax=Enterococcus saccharolyticus subsp. saccharolyticus ATCC 43076 TaxID=1139996 RepID=S0JAT3_9ENTE|nr:DNA alkylation repair protein [Enterococcus saccharolyticus]EOT29412.1 hypothetical protein OMQ_01364 [Enterococcus saccharolyticus subsp. saccharolyticus ATCC 43076]EOT81210.1 hypothetical protein I572_01742 [Enterococcus saccharolyticus subsp. saccharolyticus ATCC 43076]OJG88463.1 hypothetical protein RV16_GL000205 [Enterococcus saccharolyticus]
MFERIVQQFLEAADPNKAEKMAAYMRNQFLFLGVSAPQRQMICKEFYKESTQQEIDWHFVFECWACPYRELQYVAIGYLQVLKKKLEPEDVGAIQRLAQTKSWWDTIDGLDKLMGELAFQYPEVKSILIQWSTAEDFWLRRIAIDHQLLRKHTTDVELLRVILENNLNQSEFFINKAIGWSLRDYSKTNPEWVRDFIEAHRKELTSLSIREASKYL